MVGVESRATRDEKSRSSAPGARLFPAILSRQRITYLASGAVTAVIYCGILAVALYALGDSVPYLLLVLVSHLGAVVIVYPWYRLVVFRGAGGSWMSGYLRFYAVGLSFLGASLVGLPLLVELAGLPILVAQSLIVLVSPVLSHAIHRTWTFRHRDA